MLVFTRRENNRLTAFCGFDFEQFGRESQTLDWRRQNLLLGWMLTASLFFLLLLALISRLRNAFHEMQVAISSKASLISLAAESYIGRKDAKLEVSTGLLGSV